MFSDLCSAQKRFVLLRHCSFLENEHFFTNAYGHFPINYAPGGKDYLWQNTRSPTFSGGGLLRLRAQQSGDA
jgi:hypothetical protein